MKAFANDNAGIKDDLSITSVADERVSVFVIRCWFLEYYLSTAAHEGNNSDIQNDHNILTLFLHEVLFPDDPPIINRQGDNGMEIDVILRGRRSEVKTKRKIHVESVEDFVNQYFDTMVGTQGDKQAWWLVHFNRAKTRRTY